MKSAGPALGIVWKGSFSSNLTEFCLMLNAGLAFFIGVFHFIKDFAFFTVSTKMVCNALQKRYEIGYRVAAAVQKNQELESCRAIRAVRERLKAHISLPLKMPCDTFVGCH